jgi:hypothetical protein
LSFSISLNLLSAAVPEFITPRDWWRGLSRNEKRSANAKTSSWKIVDYIIMHQS